MNVEGSELSNKKQDRFPISFKGEWESFPSVTAELSETQGTVNICHLLTH